MLLLFPLHPSVPDDVIMLRVSGMVRPVGKNKMCNIISCLVGQQKKKAATQPVYGDHQQNPNVIYTANVH